MSEDRRTGERHLSCFPAHIEHEQGSPHTAIIRDVSVNGAHLVTSARFHEGDAIKLALYISADVHNPRMVSGKVVRFDSQLDNRSDWPFSLGVQFDEPLRDCEADIKALADKQAKLFGPTK